LAYRLHVGGRNIGETASQPLRIKRFDKTQNALVRALACLAQIVEIRMQDQVERARQFAFTGKAMQPDEVSYENMIECAAHAGEECTRIAAELLLSQQRGSIIERAIGPAVIGGHHLEMLLQGRTHLPGKIGRNVTKGLRKWNP